MPGPILAAWPAAVEPAVKILAIFGGAVLGGLLLGYFTQVLVRMVSTQKMPTWARNVVRLLGAVVVGWVLALWLFGGPGPGIGGSGGWGFGQDSGSGTSKAKAPEKGGPSSAKETPEVPSADSTVRIEVLGPDALQRLSGKADQAHCYRVDTEAGPRLMSLPEVKDFLRGRLKKEPPLRRVSLVLYKDSPDKSVPLVRELKDWAGDLTTDGSRKMPVDVLESDKNAP
jgi:hypothetical protein